MGVSTNFRTPQFLFKIISQSILTVNQAPKPEMLNVVERNPKSLRPIQRDSQNGSSLGAEIPPNKENTYI